MNLHTLAAILLVLRIIAAFFLLLVLVRQFSLFRLRDDKLSSTRRLLFGLVLITFIGQFIPIVLDSAALFGSYIRGVAHPQVLGIAYALSNATTACISAFGWWCLYRIIEVEGIRLAKVKDKLAAENKVRQGDLEWKNDKLTADLKREKLKH